MRLSNIQGVIAEIPFAAPWITQKVNSSSTWGTAGVVATACKKRRPALNTSDRRVRWFCDGRSVPRANRFRCLANIRSQLADMNRKITAKIISQLNGLFDADKNGPQGSQHRRRGCGRSNARTTATDIIKAKSAAGERAQQFDILIIHPDVRHHLENLGMTIFEGSPGAHQLTISRYRGNRTKIIISECGSLVIRRFRSIRELLPII